MAHLEVLTTDYDLFIADCEAMMELMCSLHSDIFIAKDEQAAKDARNIIKGLLPEIRKAQCDLKSLEIEMKRKANS